VVEVGKLNSSFFVSVAAEVLIERPGRQYKAEEVANELHESGHRFQHVPEGRQQHYIQRTH
jgi:hypothetical protein